jgi:hypothetical protein
MGTRENPSCSSEHDRFFPPLLSEGAAPRRVSRRVFNSPQLARTIGRVFDTTPRAPPWGRTTARRRRPTPCRQSSTTHPVRGAQTCALPWGREGSLLRTPERARGSAASSALRTALTLGCAGGVVARGRAASPTKAGGKSEYLRALTDAMWVQTRTYPFSYPRSRVYLLLGNLTHRARTIGRCVFDSPERAVWRLY